MASTASSVAFLRASGSALFSTSHTSASPFAVFRSRFTSARNRRTKSDQRDLLFDMVGRLAPDRRQLDVEQPEISDERLGVAFSEGPGRHAAASALTLDLVLAFVLVGQQVADIGDIDDMTNRIAVEFEGPTQQILEEIGSQIADMGMVVDGRATAIQPDPVRVNRTERPQRALPGVVKKDFHRIAVKG
ncbi:hypothetical protein WI40_07550 [Burkholderia ubonensis]|nr:hypothetical protein WI40_07550 [Burkholderia ubonensis]